MVRFGPPYLSRYYHPALNLWKRYVTRKSGKELLSTVFSVFTNRWFIFFAVLISSRVIIGHFFDLRSRCEDGWFSPSIGTQGACSHHNGVDYSRAELALMVSVVAGAATGFGTKWCRELVKWYRDSAAEHRIRKTDDLAREKVWQEEVRKRQQAEKDEQKDLERQRAAYRALPPEYEINQKLEYQRLLKLAEDRARQQIEGHQRIKK